jgi:hypothetical protein
VEIHPPHPIHSFRQFLLQILTITVGILIALSLDGFLEWRHHVALVRESRNNLSLEIQENRQRLEQGLTRAPEAEQRLQNTIVAIEAFRKNPAHPPQTPDWSFGVFALSSTAWHTASSTGALSFMSYSDVQQYTRAYVLQDQFLSMQERTLDKWLDLQRWSTRIGPSGFAGLNTTELFEIEDEASATLVHTRTEESFAKALVDEYSKTLGQGQH